MEEILSSKYREIRKTFLSPNKFKKYRYKGKFILKKHHLQVKQVIS